MFRGFTESALGSGGVNKLMATYCFVGVWGNAKGLLQTAAVLVHAQREVSVALVHSCHPFLDLTGVTVAFLAEAISQLDQQLHTFLGLLWKQNRMSLVLTYMRENTEHRFMFVSSTLAVMWKSSCSFRSSCV